MNTPYQATSRFDAINRELHASSSRTSTMPAETAGAAIAVTDLCRVYRNVRPHLEGALACVEENLPEALPLCRHLIRIADNACKVRSQEHRSL